MVAANSVTSAISISQVTPVPTGACTVHLNRTSLIPTSSCQFCSRAEQLMRKQRVSDQSAAARHLGRLGVRGSWPRHARRSFLMDCPFCPAASGSRAEPAAVFASVPSLLIPPKNYPSPAFQRAASYHRDPSEPVSQVTHPSISEISHRGIPSSGGFGARY